MDTAGTNETQKADSTNKAASRQSALPKDGDAEKYTFIGFSILTALFTVGWCLWLGEWNKERVSLLFAACFASFAVGSLMGFLLTIFGDEVEPFGKIQNSVVAIASGLAGVGIAKMNELGGRLGEIQLLGKPSSASYWFSALFVIAYLIAGFYFMYLLRQLVLNPALAKSRNEIKRIQLSGSAEDVATNLAKVLTPEVLLGKEYITDANDPQSQELKGQLSSNVVDQFLEQSERDIESGKEISPGNIARAAVIQYYRSYFEKEGTPEREAQLERAVTWISRALLRDPAEPGFNLKLADVLGMQERYGEAVLILEQLERSSYSPQFVAQWLGFYLLYIDGREPDAIRFSLEYHRRFPDESGGLFNASRGYGQLYNAECRKGKVAELRDSKNLRNCLKRLKEAVEIDPENRNDAKKYSAKGKSFELVSATPEFREIVEQTAAKPE